MYKKTGFTILIFILSLLVFSCGNNQEENNTQNEPSSFGRFWRSIIGNFSSEDSFYLSPGSIDSFLVKYPDFKVYKEDLVKFYTERDSAYAWYDKRGLIEHAGNLVTRLENIDKDLPGDTVLYAQQLDKLMDRPNREKNREELELMLSSQYFFIAHKIWQGMDDKEVKRMGWFVPREKVSTAAFLDSLLKTDKGFMKDEPVNPLYFKLRDKVIDFREELEKHKDLPEIQYTRDLKPGDTSYTISAIRKKLFALGDLKSDDASNLFDDELLSGVHSFQKRHGLAISDIINKKFISELKVPLIKIMEKLLVNLERTRWLPTEFSDSSNYIIVNIPEFKVHMYNGDEQIWESRVVVGEELNRTVIFKGMLDHIVFSPHWNIPESIVKNEILPAIEKDKDYLEKQDLEIVDDSGEIPVIRQRPGKENSLGQVKFMFPNTYNIYLHDSPAKHLYNREVRTFSHGCIRVEKAAELAKILLKDNDKWSDEAIKEAMDSGIEKYVNLPQKIPVYILYFTAWVDDEGNLNFRDDIYGYDSRLASGLFKETGGLNLNQTVVFRE